MNERAKLAQVIVRAIEGFPKVHKFLVSGDTGCHPQHLIDTIVKRIIESKGEAPPIKVYILTRLNKIGSCDSEEILRASGESSKQALIDYAERYHLDMTSDPEDMGYYKGLVIYESRGEEEPYIAYEWPLDNSGV